MFLVVGCDSGETPPDGAMEGMDARVPPGEDGGPEGCATPLMDCAGVCVDGRSDPMNCGVCGARCGAGTVCADGVCVAGCPAGTTECSGGCVE